MKHTYNPDWTYIVHTNGSWKNRHVTRAMVLAHDTNTVKHLDGNCNISDLGGWSAAGVLARVQEGVWRILSNKEAQKFVKSIALEVSITTESGMQVIVEPGRLIVDGKDITISELAKLVELCEKADK